MAVATSTLMMTAAGVQAGSSLLQGMQAKDQANANAKVYEQQANLALAQGELGKYQAQKVIKKYENQAVAQSALNSGGLSGSYLQNLNDTYTNAELELSTIEFNSALQAHNYMVQAENEKTKGDQAMTQGVLNAGTSLLKGASGMPA